MNKLKSLGKYSSAITFLALEIFALLAFSFSGSFVVFGSISLALMVLLILFNIAQIKIDGLSTVGFYFIPLLLFTLVTALGQYSLFHVYLGDKTNADLAFIPLGLLPIAFIGYLSSIDRNFKLKNLLIVIFGGLALYSFLNLLVNLVNFGAFYPIRLKDYYLYYSGLKSSLPVNKFAYALEGFKFIEVEMSHYVLYPALLLTSSVMLLYVSPKQEKKTFIIYALYTFIALLSLVLVPSILSLASIVVVALLLLVIYFSKRYLKVRKAFKVILVTFLVLFGIFYLVYLLNNQSSMSGISNMIKGNGLLNRIFNSNALARAYNPLVTDIFSHVFGFGFVEVDLNTIEVVNLSGGMLFDSFATSGLFGALAIFAYIIIGFASFKKYFKSRSDKFELQATMLLFLIVFVGYSSFFNSAEYALYYDVITPFYMSAPFMIMVFMFAYIFSMAHKPIEREAINEESK